MDFYSDGEKEFMNEPALKLSTSRKIRFQQHWFGFLRECRRKNLKMNQTIAAEAMQLKRSTFSCALNNGPSDTVILRFSILAGIQPQHIDPTLSKIKQPLEVQNSFKVKLAANG